MGYNGSLRRSVEKKDIISGYRKLAESGDAVAQYIFGDSYLNGYGVDRDEEEAVKWFRKSAEQGYSMAQYKLGKCYFEGLGVGKN